MLDVLLPLIINVIGANDFRCYFGWERFCGKSAIVYINYCFTTIIYVVKNIKDQNTYKPAPGIMAVSRENRRTKRFQLSS